MTTHPFDLKNVHPSWLPCIQRGIQKLNPQYRQELAHSNEWLPGAENIFNAFSQPLDKVNYVLFGESPYPRRESANGYAFWDAAVNELWSTTGLSKKVNRATSLRNILKMLLIAEGMTSADRTTQDDIAKIDKSSLIQTNEAFFLNLIQHGFLLLNATPVLQSDAPPHKDAKAWLSFTNEILTCLTQKRPHVKFILFGRIANTINELLKMTDVDKLYAEHPYNISFITNPEVIAFFRPLHLLRKNQTL